VQTPGGAAGQFAAHQALSVALRAQQAGAVGGGAVPVAGNSAKEASSFGPAVHQGHKSLAEMREERQEHPNMESVFRRTYSSPSALVVKKKSKISRQRKKERKNVRKSHLNHH